MKASQPIGLIALAVIFGLLSFCLVSTIVTVLFWRFRAVSSTTTTAFPVLPIIAHAPSGARGRPTISALITWSTMLAIGPAQPAILTPNPSLNTIIRPPTALSSGNLSRFGSWRPSWSRARMGLLGVTFREFVSSSSSSIFSSSTLPSMGDFLEKYNGMGDQDVDNLEAGRTGILNTTDTDLPHIPLLARIRLTSKLFKAMEEEEPLHTRDVKHIPQGPLDFIVEEDEEAEA